MPTNLRTVAFNDSSHDVTLLHQTLSALGLSVADAEVERAKAGADTRRQVRALQKQLGVAAENGALIDVATATAISELLGRRGLTAASRSFTVSGTVALPDGTPKRNQALLAFDVDLKGIAVYRDAQTLQELEDSGGFEFLGRTESGGKGQYELTFYDWQYRRAERKKADVVVFAVAEVDGETRILGRSERASAEAYSETGLVRNLDVLVSQQDERTEYEVLMSSLEPFLRENEVALREIADSSEQLAFTASELDLEPARLQIAAAAELLMPPRGKRSAHEILYGIGRQDIRLDWAALQRKSEEELRAAIAKSAAEHIIGDVSARDVGAALQTLRTRGATHVLSQKDSNGRNALNDMLATALPREAQRGALLAAARTFRATDARAFWTEHLPAQPEFAERPELIARLQLTQQLALLSGDHAPLVNELQQDRGIDSAEKLLDLSDGDWLEIVRHAGVPDSVQGADEDDRARRYVSQMQGLLDSAFPTKRIARMVDAGRLPIETASVARGIKTFLTAQPSFDFASSRVHDFEEEIENAGGAEVKRELMKLQRVFQVSTSPEAMSALLERKLDSAHSIASTPLRTFVAQHAQALGGESAAYAVHQRASHIAARSEDAALQLFHYSEGIAPRGVLSDTDVAEARATLQGKLPNYTNLFGSPDLCECQHCRSIYGGPAYLVELLRFLARSTPNDDDRTPLDLLSERRPDLVHLLLTCENTNTVIPYLDLANEVMEYYTAHGSLVNFKGYDTGKASADELRASPQHFDLDAYRKLRDAKHPFTLPYHQPLEVIRSYGESLKLRRYDVMNAVNPKPSATVRAALSAESLCISQEEHQILTGRAFDGSVAVPTVHECFGYTTQAELEGASAVLELLHRAGIHYAELVELVKTRFVNPHQDKLVFTERLLSHASIDAKELYNRFAQIDSGALDPANDPELRAALTAHNLERGASLTPADLAQWVRDHFDELRQVVTLYEPQSRCDLETTQLRTIRSIYEAGATSGVSLDTWSRLHRFVRLWRKLGWSIEEADVVLAALGQSEITAETISQLAALARLAVASKLAPKQLAALFGSIDTRGDASLYDKLFLDKAIAQLDPGFERDSWGDVPKAATTPLAQHEAALLATFRMRADELKAVYDVARVIDSGNTRKLDPATDLLTLPNLSTLYRHAVLAKSAKLRAGELCKLIEIFELKPFSFWDVQQRRFVDADPAETLACYELLDAIKQRGLKAAALDYVLRGKLPLDSKLGLDRAKALETVRAIREAFSSIERGHPDAAPAPLAPELVTAKLSLTFAPALVSRFIDMLSGNGSFEASADGNLDVKIPEALAGRFSYVKASGRLRCNGVVTAAERVALKALANTNASFDAAVESLYDAPKAFLAENFKDVFPQLDEACGELFDHPAQALARTLEQRLQYTYRHVVPLLKARLRRDAIQQYIATLIGVAPEIASLLVASDVAKLVQDLSTEGFSATYFGDAAWTNAVHRRSDPRVSFSWGNAAPHVTVPADNFSVRWQAWIAAPASGTYTLIVDVAEADDVFELYLDDASILSKATGDARTSFEVEVSLDPARPRALELRYADLATRAGIQLRWRTASSAPEPVPAAAAYPAAIAHAFFELATRYHRAALLIAQLELGAAELSHLIGHPADFAGIDFQALSAAHWRRLRDYVELRDAVPQAGAFLTDVFAAANRARPAPSVSELTGLLSQATAWNSTDLDFLVAHFALGVGDFKNATALAWIHRVMQIAARTGLAPKAIADFGAARTDFDELHAIAQRLKSAVKATRSDEEWPKLSGKLSDEIRESQSKALSAYLLTQPAIRNWGAEDADGLFEFFLIDVQMGACMDSSRIVQAHAAVQMFIQRCLLGLESDTTSGSEKGVAVSAIDPKLYEPLAQFRLREASLVVLCHPERLLAPEWRNDRSEFFKELESYLVQNDITERSVEQAFRNYLTSLDEVSNLEVCGIHRENDDQGGLKFLHVFGRTHNAPYKFFYRCWNKFGKWGPWERVGVDVRSVEATGSENVRNSGVHLVPVVWKKRLFLFWPEFVAVQKSNADRSKSARDLGETSTVGALESEKYFEVRLAWSERVDGKWMPKQVSKECVREYASDASPLLEKDFLLTASVNPYTQELTIWIWDESGSSYWSAFFLSDIQSPVRTRANNVNAVTTTATLGAGSLVAAFPADEPPTGQPQPEPRYAYAFSKRECIAKSPTLKLMDDVYLSEPVEHTVLPLDTIGGVDIPLDDPFFFADAKRTYFVRPMDIEVVDWLRDPEIVRPPLVVGPTPSPIPLPGPAIVPAPPVVRPGLPILTALPVVPGPAIVPAPRAAMPYSPGGNGVAVPMRLKAQASFVAPAFGGNPLSDYIPSVATRRVRPDKGLEFHTFHHPFTRLYMEALNRGGVDKLMRCDTGTASDNGDTFKNSYKPVDTFVPKPADFDTRTYYKENICSDPYGANSFYNKELFFFAPLYIAIRLSRNGKHAEAMKWFHYIFNPMSDETPAAGEPETARYWGVPWFKTAPKERLEDLFRKLGTTPDKEFSDRIAEWREHPFDPHRIASPLAYMKHTVLAYVENLIQWADSLFRRDTRESVNEALQLYVIANHVLGPRPEFVPRRGESKPESYQSLAGQWDDLSNALVELENLFPYSSEANVVDGSAGPSLLGVGSTLYFGIPPDERLIDYWDRVADRLFKIRNCRNIDGVERKLALFAPKIDPALLVQAASQGLSLGSILADLSSPPPLYRFSLLIQKANEFCADVKALGSALLAALEKKDAEELARLRASHETQMLGLITAVRERQVLDAKVVREQLVKSRQSAEFRMQHYLDLLGDDSVTVPELVAVNAELTASSALPADTTIAVLKVDVDESLQDSDERGVKLIPREARDLALSQQAASDVVSSAAAEIVSGLMGLIPQFDAELEPLGVGAATGFGGRQLSWFAGAFAKGYSASSQVNSMSAAQASKMASYIRREQDWTLQANLAAREIIQLDKQITSAEIRVQVAEKELENHKQQQKDAEDVELFLKDKFTRQELYQWLKEQLFSVSKQSYDLAYDMAKKAEKAYRFELGAEAASFIQYGYWDDSRQGLVAGEKLQLALRQLEKAYLEGNFRERELTRNFSLKRLDPLALVQLRETGHCQFSIREEDFDLDFRSHYFRRLKAVRVSIPCIVGPNTPVSCTLRLLSNSVRINDSMNSSGDYEHENDEGIWIDDDRFETRYTPVTAMATSSGSLDPGMFEFSFTDPRLLPFEGAGAISTWSLELATRKELWQFDQSTITDVGICLYYTARESAGQFEKKSTEHLLKFLENADDRTQEPLMQLVSMKHDFPSEWHRFLHPAMQGAEQVLDFTLGGERFPFLAHERQIVVTKLDVFARSKQNSAYNLVADYTDRTGNAATSSDITIPQRADTDYGDLRRKTLRADEGEFSLDEMDVDKSIRLKLKRTGSADYTSLMTAPVPEIEDLFLVLSYRLAPSPP